MLPRLGPLAGREFRLLFTGQLVSLLGTAVAPIALAFAVLDLTHSATDLGLVLAAGWIPQLLLVLFGGVFADRLPRHLVMVGSNLLSAGAQGAIALLLLTHHAQLWHLIALQVVRGIATSFFFPASQGLVPETVPTAQLQQANALLGLTRNVTSILGYALGGVLVALAGPGWALAFDAATYAASAVVLAGMRLRRSERLAAGEILHDLAEGWSEFASRTWLWSIVVAAGFGNMAAVGSSMVLGPLVAKESLDGASSWAAILACEGAGFLVGGIVLLRWRPQRPLLAGECALLVWALPLALLASVPSTPLIAAAFFLSGMALELFNVAWSTALQQHVPLDKLSRVSAYDALGSFVFIPLGLTIVGPVAEVLGVSETLWLGAAICVTATLAALSVRDVRELRRTDDAPPGLALEGSS
ncbi:MAG TPA: MFS transporter [Gaiellaceae bacterium]|nr:MFS transporter [Gaiellaceae bacterium]